VWGQVFGVVVVSSFELNIIEMRISKTNKTRKVRKAPEESATSMPEGTIKSGWVIKKAANGVPRWLRQESVELNGFKMLTIDYVSKHIGTPITLFCREFKSQWPSKSDWSSKKDLTHYSVTFTPSGNARMGSTIFEGWVKSRKPPVKKNSMFFIDGPIFQEKELIADGVQLDSHGQKLMSLNLMNTEVFVK
jgi:hypothetical protein